MSRDDNVRPEIAAEAEQSRQSREEAEQRLQTVRTSPGAGWALAELLAELNAANGFAELLVRDVIRGSS